MLNNCKYIHYEKMNLIAAANVVLRKSEGLPTLIVDVREEFEAHNFMVIDEFKTKLLNETTFGGVRITPRDIIKHKTTLFGWTDRNSDALVVVSSTRFFKHCVRVEAAFNELSKYGIRTKVLNPHLYDLHNLLLGQRLNRILVNKD